MTNRITVTIQCTWGTGTSLLLLWPCLAYVCLYSMRAFKRHKDVRTTLVLTASLQENSETATRMSDEPGFCCSSRWWRWQPELLRMTYKSLSQITTKNQHSFFTGWMPFLCQSTSTEGSADGRTDITCTNLSVWACWSVETHDSLMAD